MVVGESGSGKSALLANWWQEQRNKTKTKTNFFAHFIGIIDVIIMLVFIKIN